MVLFMLKKCLTVDHNLYRQEEFAINETIEHWRPKHGKRLTELAIAIGRAEGWLKSRKDLVI